jgi:hypothetical protein
MTGEGERARWGDFKKIKKNWERDSEKEREGDFWVEKKTVREKDSEREGEKKGESERERERMRGRIKK